MKKICGIIGVVGALALVASAAAPQFEEVPAGANKALKAVKGNPIRSGMVFVNGHYLKPSYVLMRSGTALFINYSTQITGQVIPWKAFLATQGGGAAAAPQPAAPVPPRPVQNVDDLFADTPSPAAKAPAAAAASTAATVEEETSFTPNEQTKRMLKRINDRRSYYDRKLREGNVIFFGTRYASVSVPRSSARALLAVLPEAMRDANDGAQLHAMLRGKGISYLNREVCDDLIANRQDYLQIIERRKEMEKNDELQSFLD